jgi:hypothetical protein
MLLLERVTSGSVHFLCDGQPRWALASRKRQFHKKGVAT